MNAIPGAAFDAIDPRPLIRWLDENAVPGAGEHTEITPLPGGSQNQLFAVHRGAHHFALRAAPEHADLERGNRMAREFRFVRALHGTDVPHATAYAFCADRDVLGQPFYVMELVDGWSPMSRGWEPPFDHDLEARRQLAHELIDGAARLARVDWLAAGLSDLGRPEGFHERQVQRWTSFLSEYQFRELPDIDVTAAWLQRNKPSSFRPGIMHGDYQFANVMFGHGRPGRLAAIVDFEMTTIGDPLLDLGWALIAWGTEGEDMVRSRYLDFTGLPEREELLEHYADVSGLSVEHIDYYVVLARFKLAIVLEQTVARQVARGVPESEARFGENVLELARKASQLAESATL